VSTIEMPATVFPGATVQRVLPAVPTKGLAGHVAHFGALPIRGTALIGDVEAAGLRGRGGARFPTGVKMRAVAKGRRPVLVANGTEGEPASAKDKTLLSIAPHLVLDGIAAAAGAIGASEAILCIERSASGCIPVLQEAIAERRSARYDRLDVRVEETPDRYVAGEASALVQWLNGGEAKPTFTLGHLTDRGVAGRPTLVDNVETFAHIALIARHGAGWFANIGTPGDPGSALITVSGSVSRPGVYEIAMGAGLEPILTGVGADLTAIEAVLIGGYFGTWIPAGLIRNVSLETESLAKLGGAFGCGIIAVLPQGACGLAEAARVARWLSDQNAGQCGPCMNGLPAIADSMQALVDGDRSGRAEKNLHRWLGMVTGRGACKHPDGAARFVQSSLWAFHEEVAAHRRRGPCRGAVGYLPTPIAGAWR